MKYDNKYILNIKDTIKEMEYLKVCALLPRASYLNENGHFVSETSHCLEDCDIFNGDSINEDGVLL